MSYIDIDIGFDDKELERYKILEGKIEAFLDVLSRLHNNRNHIEIKKVLGMHTETKYSAHAYSYNLNKQEDNTIKSPKKYVAVRAGNNIKRTINSIRYILPGKVFTTWIENVLTQWVNKLNRKESFEINLLFENYEFKNIENNSYNSINFTVDVNLWDSFVLRCKRSGLTISDGVKYAVIDFILSKEDAINQ